MRGFSIQGFSNFRTITVQNLENALQEITKLIVEPHFQTQIGRQIPIDEAEEILSLSSTEKNKPILVLTDSPI